MSKSHGIVATQWQLESARKNQLKAVILPLQKYFNFPIHEVAHNGLGMAVYNNGFNMGFVENCFSKNERIYLQSEWAKVEDNTHLVSVDGNVYFTEVDTPEAEILGWQPAETMPMEAALYRYKIANVEVKQCKDIGFADLWSSGLADNASPKGSAEVWDLVECAASRWNSAFPLNPWENECWVVVLRLEADRAATGDDDDDDECWRGVSPIQSSVVVAEGKIDLPKDLLSLD